MLPPSSQFEAFADILANNNADALLRPEDRRLTLKRFGFYEIRYAPFDWVNDKARLVVVGITPGKAQARRALEVARNSIAAGLNAPQAAERSKFEASFCGDMRGRLSAMLDYIGIAKVLGIAAAEELFAGASSLIHWTSAIRYPLLKDGKPSSFTAVEATKPGIAEAIVAWLGEEVRLLPEAPVLALGPAAKAAAELLIAAGRLERHRLLGAIVHPGQHRRQDCAYFLGQSKPPRGRSNPAAIDARRVRVMTAVADWGRCATELRGT